MATIEKFYELELARLKKFVSAVQKEDKNKIIVRNVGVKREGGNPNGKLVGTEVMWRGVMANWEWDGQSFDGLEEGL